MTCLFSRSALASTVGQTFTSAASISQALGDVTLPAELRNWLSRLRLLYGVPFHYLVPDEHMLPPESIRFFSLDMNWVDALLDGAFSIGRNLTTEDTAAGMNMDRAVTAPLKAQAAAGTAHIRAAAFGVPPPAVSLNVITGFVLRSSIVTKYPGLGVFAHGQGKAPLTLLRFELLGPGSDTMLCLVDGDVAQVDLCEPPEGLHYGIDHYQDNSGSIEAWKNIHTFTTEPNDDIEFDPNPTKIEIGPYFRSVAPRTVRLAPLGAFIASKSNLSKLNSAQMGFEMSQGVGLVSFQKRTSPQ